jgi:hypothetical protein
MASISDNGAIIPLFVVDFNIEKSLFLERSLWFYDSL